MQRTALLALLCFLPACASETFFQDNRKNLDQGLAALASDPAAAVRQADAVVTRTSEEAGTYALQRFFAQVLATRAHLAACERGAFLPDAVNKKAGGIRLAAAAASLADAELPVAHMVAALYHASLGLEGLSAAERRPAKEDGKPVLPAAFEELTTANAGASLLLAEIALFARLRFQGKVDLLLRDPDHAALLEYATCQPIAERAGLAPWLRAWLDYAVFGFHRRDDAVQAYKFAVAAIALEDAARGAFPRARVEELEQFVVANPAFEWFCTGCGNTSPPSLPRCITCNQVATVDFAWRKKDGR